MSPELKAKWIEALRSGKYKQGISYLHAGERYCCLGVLYELSGGRWIEQSNTDAFRTQYGYCGYLGPSRNELGLSEMDSETLAHMNDDGKTFPEIAAYIEQNL